MMERVALSAGRCGSECVEYSDPRDYEKVYAFGIDFNYLLKNYNKPDYVIIDTLCKKIEKLIDIHML